MMRRIIVTIFAAIMMVALVACGNSANEDSTTIPVTEQDIQGAQDNQDTHATQDTQDDQEDVSEQVAAGDESISDMDAQVFSEEQEDSDMSQQLDSNTHYYKTIRIIGDTYFISPSISGVIECDFGFEEYLPTLTIQYNTTTGMAESAEYCNYYPYASFDEDGNEFLQADLEALSTGEGDMLSRFSNFNTEVMEAEELTKLSFDIDISTYNTYMDSVVNTYLLAGEQDIEGYRESMNFDEEGENYYYDTHVDLRLEWED